MSGRVRDSRPARKARRHRRAVRARGRARHGRHARPHRGPDARGFVDYPGVSIGMTRLSIIDLETGDPPIANEDGSVWVVFNGEIYNYAERRARARSRAGHVSARERDTEVIVHLYEEHGAACVEQLPRHVRLRRLGRPARRAAPRARPLRHQAALRRRAADGSLAFASEIKALLQLPWVDESWDRHGAVARTCASDTCPARVTAYRGIAQAATRRDTDVVVGSDSRGPLVGVTRVLGAAWTPRASATPSFDEAARRRATSSCGERTPPPAQRRAAGRVPERRRRLVTPWSRTMRTRGRRGPPDVLHRLRGPGLQRAAATRSRWRGTSAHRPPLPARACDRRPATLPDAPRALRRALRRQLRHPDVLRQPAGAGSTSRWR